MRRLLLLACVFVSSLACAVEFNFEEGSGDWKGSFTDYPVGEEEFYELSWGWENLPLPIDSLTKGVYLNGNNHSDDLFMFLAKRIDGLNPNTTYQLAFEVLIESNVPADRFGVGGAPGENLFFKVGASAIEPCRIEHNGYYVLNVDKGNQSEDGESAQVIGNLANPAVDPEAPSYQPKVLLSSTPMRVMSNEEGSLWIFLGTDSGFEGHTRFYVAKVNVDLEPCDKEQSR